jgi:hypothetical protein
MSKKGYIKVYRDIQDHWMWKDERFSRGQAWVDLIMMANHKDAKIPVGEHIEIIKRGQFITSIAKLSDRWKWSYNTTKAFLNLLENDNMLIRKSDNSKTLITIVNYGVYQSGDKKNEEGVDRPIDEPIDRPTDEPIDEQTANLLMNPLIPNKNDKNVKNDKNEKNEKNTNRFVPPTVDEVRDYVIEKNYEYVNPDDFISFYESKGWMVGKNKMKNWKASVSGWNSRAKERGDKKVNLEITQELPERYKKIFYDMEAQFIAPYYGFPEEWFNGTRLDGSKVIPLTRPKDPSRGWYEPIEYSVKDLIEYYESRRRWNEQHGSGTQ